MRLESTIRGMARKRRRRGWDQDLSTEQEEAPRARRGKRRRRFHQAQAESVRVAVAEPLKPRPTTCYQCAHLVITRSMVKLVNQSWDRAVSFPTLSCFQQCWTLEDPDSLGDHSQVIEFLVDGAERCPHFQRGHPLDHRW